MKEEKREEKKVEVEEKMGSGSKASVGDLIEEGGRVQLGFRLTGRELDLLEFVLDQKFAGIDAIYQRFYAVGDSKSQRYAAERVQLLRRHGFLRAENVYTEPKLFYLTTPLARDVLQNLRPGRRQLDAVESIDPRTFEHDSRVTLCRAHREGSGQVQEWVSERRLKAEWATLSGKLSREYLPDAIYTNRRGEKVAFELELSPKTRERHAKKIARFLNVMKDGSGLFRRTLYVACDPRVKATLESLTRPYPDEFKVLSFEQVVGGDANGAHKDASAPAAQVVLPAFLEGVENHV